MFLARALAILIVFLNFFTDLDRSGGNNYYFISVFTNENVQANFWIKFNFNNYPTKSNIHHWVTKFQSIESIQNLYCMADGQIVK